MRNFYHELFFNQIIPTFFTDTGGVFFVSKNDVIRGDVKMAADC
jgi:hypothetical protein